MSRLNQCFRVLFVMTRNADLIHPYFVPEQKLPDFFIIEVDIGESKRGEIRESFAYQKEYMEQQISQQVVFYRREEKQLRLYFDQFYNLLPLKHVLQYMFNQTMCTNVLKNHSRRLKGQKRP